VTVCGRPAALTVGRQTQAEKAVRRVGVRSSVVKTSASAGIDVQVGAEGVDDYLGERNGPDRGHRLRRSRVRRSVGHGDQLDVDGQLAAQEVDPAHPEPEGLALADRRAGGQRDQHPVVIRDRFGQGLDGVGRERLDALLEVLRQLGSFARRLRLLTLPMVPSTSSTARQAKTGASLVSSSGPFRASRGTRFAVAVKDRWPPLQA
jgi:hypothetical protein